MITSIGLENFKCFTEATIPCRGLTVFAGGNAAGKSSVIQSLLLLRQSFNGLAGLQVLRLSGELLDIGAARDVVNGASASSDRSTNITVATEGPTVSFRFGYPRGEPSVRALRRVLPNSEYQPAPDDDASELSSQGDSLIRTEARALSLSFPSPLFRRNRSFCYLSADRLGPRAIYPVAPSRIPMAGLLGASGEFTAHVLASNAAQPGRYVDARSSIFESSSTPESKSTLGLTKAWLNSVVPGASIRATTEYTRAEVAYFDVQIEGSTTEYVRPTNAGFGISTALPILVAGAIARQKSLLIIENPEIHLHPSGQSKMGEFLACVAADGVQVLVETHSDHVINGIRLAVRRGRIRPTHIQLNYFQRRLGTSQFRVTPIEISQNGDLSEWPEGFFDQMDLDLSELLSPTQRRPPQ